MDALINTLFSVDYFNIFSKDYLNVFSSLEVRATIPTIERVQLLFSAIAYFFNSAAYYPEHAHVYDGQSFDFIIVGGGTAGCVLANRLTEANWNVLLIEAGGLPPFTSDVPGLFALQHFSEVDWNDTSVNDNYSAQAHMFGIQRMSTGKMLGGSSSMDYLFHIRGNKADYDIWAKMGNKGWSWHDVLPYFIKSEDVTNREIMHSSSAHLHGTHGNIEITRPDWGQKTLRYLEAFHENGRNILLDKNDNMQLGYSQPQFTINKGIRQSTAVSYIRPIKHRNNLHILYNSMVLKILIHNKVATGVQVLLPHGKVPVALHAKKEVILSAGAFNSPKLLMLSGVGPGHHLQEHNIDVVHHSPMVGQNLHDTPMAIISLLGNEDPLTVIQNVEPIINLDTFPIPFIIGHATIHPNQSYPDYELSSAAIPAGSLVAPLWCTFTYRIENDICTTLVNAGQKRESLLSAFQLLHEKSRGKVELQSNDPQTPLSIYTDYYSNEEDLENHAKYLEDYISVLSTRYFKKVRGEVTNLNVKQCSQFEFKSHEYWKCYVLNLVSTFYGYAGTCAMGAKGQGVVDNRLKVQGIKNLRVIDASVIPNTISGNPKAAVIMIAEKAADMIKADHYGYRHYDVLEVK